MGEIKPVDKKNGGLPVQGFDLDPETVKKYIAKGATDEELFMFLGICKSYGLNPFKREIHFIKYDQKSPASIVVGYETYLKRAVATGKLDGWRVWIEGKGEDMKAVIEIKRKDWSEPFRWEVHRREFDTGKSSWKKMPTFMLKKVAIAQGFRLAFPEDLGGMPYIPEEVGETVVEAQVVEEKTTQGNGNSRRAELIKEFKEVFEALGWTPDEGKAFLKEHFGKESARELTDMELAKAIGLMRRELEKQRKSKGQEANGELVKVWEEINQVIQQAGFKWQAVKEEIQGRFGKDPDSLTLEEARTLLDFLCQQAGMAKESQAEEQVLFTESK